MREKDIIFLTVEQTKDKRRRLTGKALKCLQILCSFLLVCALVTGVLYGRKVGVATALGIVAVQIFLWVFIRMEKWGYVSWKSKGIVFHGRQGRDVGISLAVVLFTALAVVMYRPSVFYDAVYRAEGIVSVTAQRLWTGEGIGTQGGTISRGNHYDTGEARLELTVSEAPEEPLYLRGFSGGDYVGNGWQEADEEPLFGKMAETLSWEEWIGMIGGMYYSMYFVVNMDSGEDEPPPVKGMHIRHLNGSYSTVYLPYYSMSRWFRRESDEVQEGYECEFFERKDMEIDWDSRPTALGQAREWYQSLQGACMEIMPAVYTQVPEEILPRLTALAAENPQESMEEITAFIAYTLESRAAYTLTPGWAPVNEDIVEYFLFENGQGYCQHFASAATLLYRLYGIPARYASGYVVQPGDFQEQDGLWRALVTDESAHAWVEIFLEDYGWTPVEVTPDAEGQISALYPGLDSAALQGLAERFRQNAQAGIAVENVRKETEVQQKEEVGYSVIFDVRKYREIYLVAGACLFCFLLFLPVLVDYLRLRRRQKLGRMGCRKVYAVMMDMLHGAGYFPEMEGWEKEFPEMAAREFPEVGNELLRRQQDIVKRAAYSEWIPDVESEELVRWVYFQLARAVAGRMKGYRRLIFKYWKYG